MTAPDAPPTIESMLAYRAWVRGLARALVADESRIDDVEQATWLAALESPPRKEAALAGWLRRVVKSRAIDEIRAESRRAARERASARHEAQSAERLVERAEILRDVAGAVCALDEPYRGTILLRHFEDFEPREIAARLGISVETIHTRLRRAHEQLRARLDREHGDRRAWCALLVPFAAKGDDRTGAAVGTGAFVLGGLTMGKLTVIAAGIVLVAAGWWFVRPAASLVEADAPKNVAAAAPAESGAGRVAVAPRATRKRDASDLGAASPAQPAAPLADQPAAAKAEGPVEAVGRVVWADTGEPAKRFEFLAVDDKPFIAKISGDDGKFRATLPHGGDWETGRYVVEGEPIAHFGPHIVVPSETATVLRVPRGGAAAVLVLAAENGAPLADARAYLAARRDFFMPGVHVVPGAATLAQPPRTAQGDGRIPLGRPAQESQWFVVAAGREWMSVAVAPGATQDVRLRPAGSLRVSVPNWKRLEAAGIVVTEGGDHMDIPPPGGDGVAVVEGLLPGRHEVVVRRGKSYEHGVVYGRGEVEIVSGAEARLAIDAEATVPRKKLVVTGTLHVPESWGGWPATIDFDGAETENADFRSKYVRLEPPAQGRDVKFTLADVPEGRYRVCVGPFQWRKEIVVSAASADLAMDLGEACEVVVKVLDDATNAPAADAKITWNTLLPGQDSWASETPEPRAGDGAFVLRAPPGTVHVDASAVGLVPVETAFEAAVGTSAPVVIRMKRGATLVAKLESDGSPFVEGRPFVKLARTADDGSSAGVFHAADHGIATFDGEAPGPCTVSIREDELAGWTCAPAQIELRLGETTTITLKLAKKP